MYIVLIHVYRYESSLFFEKPISCIWKAKKNNNDQWFIANDDVNVVTIIITLDKTGFGQQPRIQEGISYVITTVPAG